MKYGRQIVSGSLWTVLETAGVQIFGFVALVILSRELLPEDFGLIALAMVFSNLLKIVAECGLTPILVSSQDDEEEGLSTAFYTSLLLGCVMAAGLYGCAELVGAMFGNPLLEHIVKIFALIPIFYSLNTVPHALMLKHHQFKWISIRNGLGAVLSGGLAIIMVLQGYGIDSLIYQQLFSAIFVTLSFWVACHWYPKWRFSFSSLRTLLRRGMPVMGASLLDMASLKSKDVLIGLYYGEAAVGFLHIAFKLQDVVVKFAVEPLARVSLPSLSALRGDAKQFRALYLKILQATSIIAIPAFIGLAVISPQFVVLAFGEQWQVSADLLMIISLFCLSIPLRYLFKPVMVALGQTDSIFQLQLMRFILASLSLFLLRDWSFYAAIFAFTLANILVDYGMTYFTNRYAGVSLIDYFKKICAPLTLSLLMAGALYVPGLLYAGDVPVMLTLQIIVGVAIYAVGYRFVFPSQFKALSEIIRGVLRKA